MAPPNWEAVLLPNEAPAAVSVPLLLIAPPPGEVLPVNVAPALIVRLAPATFLIAPPRTAAELPPNVAWVTVAVAELTMAPPALPAALPLKVVTVTVRLAPASLATAPPEPAAFADRAQASRVSLPKLS